MFIFSVCFLLYFAKLSAGKGFFNWPNVDISQVCKENHLFTMGFMARLEEVLLHNHRYYLWLNSASSSAGCSTTWRNSTCTR